MKKILILALALMCSCAQAKIQELPSYAGLDLTQITPETLVVFDIDNTLIRQNQMIGTHQWGDYMAARAVRRGVSVDEARQMQHQAFAEVQPSVAVVPVEESVRNVLNLLSQKSVAHFALTARAAVLKDVTRAQLKILNHSFAQSFPEQKDPAVLADYLNDGIIFSGATPKGELLKKIIDNSKTKFTKIIFIDDKLYNLESVEKSFEQSNIILESYRYGAADSVVNAFNPQVADIEYSIFKDQHQLISDQEALSLVGSPQRMVNTAFDFLLMKQGPLATPQDGCEEVQELLFRCRYMHDHVQPMSVDYEVKRDEFTQGYYFGSW